MQRIKTGFLILSLAFIFCSCARPPDAQNPTNSEQTSNESSAVSNVRDHDFEPAEPQEEPPQETSAVPNVSVPRAFPASDGEVWNAFVSQVNASPLCGGLFEGVDRPWKLYVTDIDAFKASPLMAQKEALVEQVILVQCRYSYAELLAAREKLWESTAAERYKITGAVEDIPENTVIVYTEDISEANKNAIADFCGIQNIRFIEGSAVG